MRRQGRKEREATRKVKVGVDYGTGTNRDYRISIMKVDENEYLLGQQTNIWLTLEEVKEAGIPNPNTKNILVKWHPDGSEDIYYDIYDALEDPIEVLNKGKFHEYYTSGKVNYGVVKGR